MTTASFSASFTDLVRSHLWLISAMPDYDREAARYDVTRGGDARARAPAPRLPGQERARPDSVYERVALRKES